MHNTVAFGSPAPAEDATLKARSSITLFLLHVEDALGDPEHLLRSSGTTVLLAWHLILEAELVLRFWYGLVDVWYGLVCGMYCLLGTGRIGLVRIGVYCLGLVGSRRFWYALSLVGSVLFGGDLVSVVLGLLEPRGVRYGFCWVW